jgi:hypothetical protein
VLSCNAPALEGSLCAVVSRIAQMERAVRCFGWGENRGENLRRMSQVRVLLRLLPQKRSQFVAVAVSFILYHQDQPRFFRPRFSRYGLERRSFQLPCHFREGQPLA